MTRKRIGVGLGLVGVLVATMGATALTSAADEKQPAEELEYPHQDVWVNGEPEELLNLSIEERAGMARTARLWPTWDELQEFDGFVDGGYESLESDRLLVYWYGERTPELEGVLQAAADRGLDSVVVEVHYTKQHLADATRVLNAALLEANIIPDGVGPRNDLEGLFIELPSFDAAPETLALAERIAAEALPDFSVEVRVIDMPEPPDGEWNAYFSSRPNDTGSVDAGSFIRRIDYAACSTGINFSRPGYGDYQLTAAHCSNFYNDIDFFTFSGARHIGHSRGTQITWGAGSGFNSDPNGPRLDANVIQLRSGIWGTTQMFLGPYNTSAKYTVNGTAWIPWSHEPLATALCTNGGATGLRCNLVRETEQVLRCIGWIGSTCVRQANVVGLIRANGQVVFGEGDSGGPVYVLMSNGKRLVTSIVQGYRPGTEATCGSVHGYDPTAFCSYGAGRVTAMSSIMNALSPHGFNTKISP